MRKYLLPIAFLALGGLQVADARPHRKTVVLIPDTNPVVFGHRAEFSGYMTGQDTIGKTIEVEADTYPYTAGFQKVATTVTDRHGTWDTIVKPPLVKTRYRARQGSTTSNVETQLVRLAVGIKLSDTTPRAGARVSFSGRACPQHDGALVRIERREGPGRWHAVVTTSLRDLPGSTCSRYAGSHRIFRDGAYRARVVPPDLDHTDGFSPRRKIDVH